MEYVVIGAAVRHETTTPLGETYGGWTGTVESTTSGLTCAMGPEDLVHLVARVGADDMGEYRAHILSRYGERCVLDGLIADPMGTNVHIAWETTDGWRQNRAARQQTPILMDELPLEAIRRADAVMFASGDVDNYDDALIGQVRGLNRHALIYVDIHCKVRRMDETGLWHPCVWEGWPAHLASADVVQTSTQELWALLGVDDFDRGMVEHAVDKLLDAGIRQVCLTMGELGCLVADGDGTFTRVPTMHVPTVLDLSGAGDAFAGAYIVARTHGHSAVEAARRGCVLGALAVSKVGLLTPDDVPPGTIERLLDEDEIW